MARIPFAIAAAAVLFGSAAFAQTSSRIRGTISSVDGAVLQIAPNNGGAQAAVTLSPKTIVVALVPAKLSDIAAGSFIGTAAETQADGTLVAREVHIFSENMRGAGEGHRAFDLGPTSSMTNGTVGHEVESATGDKLTVSYKGGEQTIIVPAGAPIVMFAPGDRNMLVAGAHVQLQTKAGAGNTLTADRVTVGKDGLVPPM